MVEALAVEFDSEEPKGRHLKLAGLETEAKERRVTEAFRTTQITINLPEQPSEIRRNLVFFSARTN